MEVEQEEMFQGEMFDELCGEHSNDLCFYNPVRSEETRTIADQLYQLYQPPAGAERRYSFLPGPAGLLLRTPGQRGREFDKKEGCRKYWISNLKGYVNGWCHIKHIYGKLSQIEH